MVFWVLAVCAEEMASTNSYGWRLSTCHAKRRNPPISFEEEGPNGSLHFRLIAIADSFAQYSYRTTLRFYSPYGTCMDRPERYKVSQPCYSLLSSMPIPFSVVADFMAWSMCLWQLCGSFPIARRILSAIDVQTRPIRVDRHRKMTIFLAYPNQVQTFIEYVALALPLVSSTSEPAAHSNPF